MMITNKKHQAFADEYMINGFKRIEAYMTVYKGVKSRAGARVSATKLLTIPNVSQYISEAQAELAEKSRVSREELVADLKMIKDDNKAVDKSPNTAIKAIDSLSKLLGYNEPDKVTVNHDYDITIPGISKDEDDIED